MTKGVFDSRAGSGYDDEIVGRYHFPPRYRQAAEAMVRDWIIYREPKTGGGQGGYIATARVARIEPDPARAYRFYARMEDYLPFDAPVPLSKHGTYYKADLRAVESRANVGYRVQGRSARALSDADFAAIVQAGLDTTLAPANAVRLGLDPGHADQAPLDAHARQVVQLLMNRTVADKGKLQEVGQFVSALVLRTPYICPGCSRGRLLARPA